MKADAYPNSKTPYFISALGGQSVFALKLLSVSELIRSLGIEFFPTIILIQSLVIAFILFLTTRLKKYAHKGFALSSLALGIITILATKFLSDSQGSLKSFFFIITCSACAYAINFSIRETIVEKLQYLQNPNSVDKINLCEELGILSYAFLFFWPMSIEVQSILSLSPMILLGIILIQLKLDQKKREHPPRFSELSPDLKKISFLALGLFSIFVFLKHIQTFSLYWGLDHLSSNDSSQVQKWYSAFSFIQTSIILGILLYSSKRKFSARSWLQGFKTHLGLQGLILLSFSLISSPLLYLSGSILRRISQHTFFSRGLSFFSATLPTHLRFFIRHFTERGSSLFASLGASLLIFSLYYFNYPIQLLWASALLCIGFGYYLSTKLFHSINQWHLKQIKEQKIRDLSSLYSFANTESAVYAQDFFDLLPTLQHPQKIKGVITALGEMKHPKLSEYFPQIFHKYSSEDLQIAIIDSLRHFKDHKTQSFFVHVFETHLSKHLGLGEFRIDLLRSLIPKISNYMIPFLINRLELESKPQIKANIITILGELALFKKDKELINLILPHIFSKYRRVKINALLALQERKEFKEITIAYINQLLNTSDIHDQHGAVFLIAESNLRVFSPKVADLLKENPCNTTLIISALKLKIDSAMSFFYNYLLAPEIDYQVLTDQFYQVPFNTRLECYRYLWEKKPSLLKSWHDQILKSNRDFTQDLLVLHRLLSENISSIHATKDSEQAA